MIVLLFYLTVFVLIAGNFLVYFDQMLEALYSIEVTILKYFYVYFLG